MEEIANVATIKKYKVASKFLYYGLKINLVWNLYGMILHHIEWTYTGGRIVWAPCSRKSSIVMTPTQKGSRLSS